MENNPDKMIPLDLKQCVSQSLQAIWTWHSDHMLDRSTEHCAQKGEDLSRVGVDGNLKLAGWICGHPVAELVESKSLGMLTAISCSEQPAFKKKRCCKHDASKEVTDPFPAQSEVMVKHRRHSILRTNPCAEPCEVYLEVMGSEEDNATIGRWMDASLATPTQLQEYWQK